MAAPSPEPLASLFVKQQADLIRETRAVARDVLAPIARAGEPGRVNRALVQALGDHGLLPRLFGGRDEPTGDVSALELCILREALAQESTESETAFALQGLGTYPVIQGGQEHIVRRWAPLVARGEAVAAFALTEPGADPTRPPSSSWPRGGGADTG